MNPDHQQFPRKMHRRGEKSVGILLTNNNAFCDRAVGLYPVHICPSRPRGAISTPRAAADARKLADPLLPRGVANLRSFVRDARLTAPLPHRSRRGAAVAAAAASVTSHGNNTAQADRAAAAAADIVRGKFTGPTPLGSTAFGPPR